MGASISTFVSNFLSQFLHPPMRPVDFQLPKELEETKKQLEVARAQIVKNAKTKKEVKIGRKALEETKKQLEVARAQIVENVKTKKEVKIGRKALEETKKQLEVARAQIVENAKTKKEVKIERKALIDSARKELGMDCVHHFNFAVSGESGTGKSSFINGIRHVNAQDEGAAEVGVTETTDEITSYPHPEVKHAVVWDLPGAGTLKHPSDTYFYDKKLYAFDCILIVSADRFRKVEFDIAKFALQNKKPIAFVRNKADVSIKDLVERKQMTAGEAATEFRKEVEKSFLDNLTQTGLLAEAENIPLFIVSSKAFIHPSIYNIQDEDPVKCDKSLQKMDEEKVFEFLLDSVKPRMDLA